MNLVKVAKLGSAVKEVALDEGATVANALRAADMTGGDFELRLNGNPATGDTRVRTGDIITLIPAIRGG
jgi:sulfur carrier protein ThiS